MVLIGLEGYLTIYTQLKYVGQNISDQIFSGQNILDKIDPYTIYQNKIHKNKRQSMLRQHFFKHVRYIN